MTTDEAPARLSLDDLIIAYDRDPSAYRRALGVFETTASPGSLTVGTSLTPIRMPLEGIEDDGFVWAGCARRVPVAPGAVVVRLTKKADGKHLSARVSFTAETHAHWLRQPFNEAAAPEVLQPSNVQPRAPQAAQAPQMAPSYQTPTDAFGLMTNMMMMMMTKMMDLGSNPRTDPAVDVLKGEVARLQAAIDAKEKKDDGKFSDYIDLVKKATDKGEGWGSLATMLAGPLDKIADSFTKTADVRAQIELRKAETKQMEVGERLAEKGLDGALEESTTQPPNAAPAAATTPKTTA